MAIPIPVSTLNSGAENEKLETPGIPDACKAIWSSNLDPDRKITVAAEGSANPISIKNPTTMFIPFAIFGKGFPKNNFIND